jgi:hypothetical protein
LSRADSAAFSAAAVAPGDGAGGAGEAVVALRKVNRQHPGFHPNNIFKQTNIHIFFFLHPAKAAPTVFESVRASGAQRAEKPKPTQCNRTKTQTQKNQNTKNQNPPPRGIY